MPLARENPTPQRFAPALTACALVQQLLGNKAVAAGLVVEFIERTKENPAVRLEHLTDATRVLVDCDELERARTLIDGVRPKTVGDQLRLLTARARFHEAQGQWQRALELYDGADSRWKEYGFVLEQGLALLGAGRCMLAQQEETKGCERVRRARGIFAVLGATALMRETDDYLADDAG